MFYFKKRNGCYGSVLLKGSFWAYPQNMIRPASIRRDNKMTLIWTNTAEIDLLRATLFHPRLIQIGDQIAQRE